MALPDISIKRPVTIVMVFLGIVLFGFISWSRLPQELYPPIVYPQLSVVTFYKDAAPEEMEILVTKPIEEAVGTVSGVRRISSISKEETSLVIAEFNWGTNMDFAALGVREKIDLIKEILPRGSDDPIVMKFNPFEQPLLVLNVTARKTSPGDLQHIVKKIIKNELEKAEGVAAVNVTGGLIPEVLVEIDQDRLMSKEIGLNEVVESLSKSNLNYPAGTIEESFYEYLIRTMGEFKVVKEMDDVVVGVENRAKKTEYSEFGPEDVKQKEERATTHKRLVLLKEIAKVSETFKDKTSISRYNGQDNISVSIQKQADANTLTVSNSVKRIVGQLRDMIPKDVKIDIVYDQSTAIRTNIRGVRDAALQGGFLAFLVLLPFLGSVRGALIVTINIPISIMAVFTLMYFSGITMNMISLGGLALGVGMLVDAAIVVIDNIYGYIQQGIDPKTASARGTNEVSLAIFGTVMTTIVVFLPMAFVIGIAGQLFKELAFTITFSLLCSLLVALTLVPVLTSSERRIPKISPITVRLVDGMGALIEKLLVFSLNHKALSLIMTALIFIGTCFLIPSLDTEFMPRIDQGQFIIKLELPPGTKLDVTDTYARVIEKYLLSYKELDTVTVNIGSTKEKKGSALLETMGSHQGQIIVNLKPRAGWFNKKDDPRYRYIPTSELIQRLKDQLKESNLKGAQVEYLLQENPFKTAFQAGAPVVVEIKGTDLSRLKEIALEAQTELGKVPGIYNIRNNLTSPAPEVKVNVFKEKATTYQLSVSDIAVSAQTAVKGYIASKFKREGEEIDIRVRLRKADRDNMTKVRMIGLRSPLEITVPLAELAYFSTGKGPIEIKRQEQQRIVVVTANIYKRSFKEVSEAVTLLLKEIKVPSGYSVELTGERQQIKESFTSLQMALILSVILVFMLMAAQFESMWQPLLIMFTIPLSVIGVVLILLATNTPLSVMVILGVIILGGIVVDNGIVLIDYVNTLRSQGMGPYDSLIAASRRRLNPILMTTLTTIFGLVPLGLALDEGSKLQQPMAIAVIGGLTISTLLSLVVIPTLYLSMEQTLAFIRNKRGLGVQTKEEKPGPEKAPYERPAVEEAEVPEEKTTQVEEQKKEGRKEKERKVEEHEEEARKVETRKEEARKEEARKEEARKEEARKEEARKEETRKKEEPKEEKKEQLPEEKLPPITAEPLPPKALQVYHEPGGLSVPKIELPPEPAQEQEEAIPLPPPPTTPQDEPSPAPTPAQGKISFELWDLLTTRQRGLISYLRQNKTISRKGYADKFSISIPTAARDLKFLIERGILVAKGPAAIGRHYLLAEGM